MPNTETPVHQLNDQSAATWSRGSHAWQASKSRDNASLSKCLPMRATSAVILRFLCRMTHL